MKTFSLLWCFKSRDTGGNRSEGNTHVDEVEVHTKEEAVEHFRKRAPGLDDSGYQKLENGSWIMAEQFSCLS